MVINKRLFHESSEIGHFSGNKRDFENEYESEEPEENPNDAMEWIERAKTSEQQKKWEEEFLKPKDDEKLIQEENKIRYLIGNSHMDMAWLWRYLQTVDKTRITFTKACVHIENIPEFTFSASQSIMFEWCRIKHPELFERIKKAVKTGRFELVGGSWVEPDTHIPSGESFVRQRLYGQLYYWKHFGKYASIDWVPDSFGFTGSIPQIMAKSNTPRFHTGKLGDNDTNRFPFSTFWWESSDGSRVLAEMGFNFPETRFLLKKGLGSSTPAFNYDSEQIWDHPNFSNESNIHQFSKYGKGDGGHGPTGEEVQRCLFFHNHGLGKLTTADEYFTIVEKELGDRLPVWNDELYYEYHRGTLTSMALVKRMNRYNEWMLPALESLNVLASLCKHENFKYPHEILDEAWKVTLFNQFHDTLPGTCIVEVYDDCWDMWCWQIEQYKKIQSDAFNIISSSIDYSIPQIVKDNLDEDTKVQPIILFNPLSFENNSTIHIPKELFVDFEPKSIIDGEGKFFSLEKIPGTECPKDFLYEILESFTFKKVINPLSLTIVYATDKNYSNKTDLISSTSNDDTILISNDLMEVKFDIKTAAIISINIKNPNNNEWKECLNIGPKKFNEISAELEAGIKIQSFNELSKDFPAWNMDKESRKKPYESIVKSVEITQETNEFIRVTTIVEYPTPNAEKVDKIDISTVTSHYSLYNDDPMLYVTLDVDFHSQKTLFKLDIPTSTGATRVDAETSYAFDNRSTIPKTPRDKARWENHMHTWINMQSPDDSFGFAVINNGKYGVDYHQGYLGITLIHGQPFFPPRYTAWVFEERFERSDAGGGFPPSWIDQGQHIFELAIYPHFGTLVDAGVIQKAHAFNMRPLIYLPSSINTKEELNYNLPVSKYPIEVSAIKPCHIDSEGAGWISEGKSNERIIIVRAVNMSNSVYNGSIDISKIPVIEIRECDLLERTVEKSFTLNKIEEKLVSINAKWTRFEIKTFALLIK